jgi:hypothetical protein
MPQHAIDSEAMTGIVADTAEMDVLGDERRRATTTILGSHDEPGRDAVGPQLERQLVGHAADGVPHRDRCQRVTDSAAVRAHAPGSDGGVETLAR